MKTALMAAKLNRRQLFKAAGAVTGLGMINPLLAHDCEVKEGTARDRFWLFGYPPGSDYFWTGKLSVMSPVEAAIYISVPNVIMVQVGGKEAKYGRFEPPFDRYAVALRPFKRVVWSIVGSGGWTENEERKQVLELAKKTPNFIGVFMDDFFADTAARKRRGWRADRVAALTLEELQNSQQKLKGTGKKLDLFAVIYDYMLDLPFGDYLKLIDVITLWTWNAADLVNLESNLAKLEKLAPTCRKILGIYTIDYPKKEPVPIPAMENQCEIGLKWLRQGRVEGMMFLGNGHFDIGYDSVEWLREWIRKVGDTEL